MGGLASAVDWWQEHQLRVLVLSSMAIQFFLLCFPSFRRRVIPGWFRFIMWLAYHGGDAVAIYALATLFNRHKDEGDGGSNKLLEVVWAPILLIHLGGCDGITAYNIEDNELWSRHLLTAVSQVTVAVYVFCKSWPPGGDSNLLLAAIMLFVVGVAKCFMKALAFKRASIYSLVSSDAAAKQVNDGNMFDTSSKLEEFVKDARDIVLRQQSEDHHQVMEEDPGTVTTHWWQRLVASFYRRRRLSSQQQGTVWQRLEQERQRLNQERGEASKLFVGLSSPYRRRIKIFENFWVLREDRAYDSVRGGLSSAFFLLYTKYKTSTPGSDASRSGALGFVKALIILSRSALPWVSIYPLFYLSHKETYKGIDVKITYVLLCCAAVLEFYSLSSLLVSGIENVRDGQRYINESSVSEDKDTYMVAVWPETVAQYSLAGYFVRNKRHNMKMQTVSFLQCKDFLDQLWCMEPCFTSARIIHLVLGYLKDGWKEKINDTASYRSFNNHSSHSGFNMNRPFDECVLLWHLITDFCFFSSSSFPDHKCAFAEPPTRKTLTPFWMLPTIVHMWRAIVVHMRRAIVHMCRAMVRCKRTSVAKNPISTASPPQCTQESSVCKAVQCRQMSNYMVYLLFVNPEMLLPGSRRNLFKTAYHQLKGILKDCELNLVCWSRCMPCGVKLIEEEEIVMRRLTDVMRERSGDGNFIDQAWDLAQELMQKDEKKRWKEIQDVWVQMLCFSASRCRGYLHAKALGKGGEFLSYVWLLLFYMGMETFPERLQRELLPIGQGNNDNTPPQTFEACTTSTAPSASTVHTNAGAGTTPSTPEIYTAEDNMV